MWQIAAPYSNSPRPLEVELEVTKQLQDRWQHLTVTDQQSVHMAYDTVKNHNIGHSILPKVPATCAWQEKGTHM